MGAITDLWKSERGLVAVLLIIAATVLASLGKLTFADWREYTLYIFGTYAAAKTITGALQIVKGSPAATAAPAPAVPPPTPPSP
jgi:hypothetical protein